MDAVEFKEAALEIAKLDWFFQNFERLIAFVGDETRQGALHLIGAAIATLAASGLFAISAILKKTKRGGESSGEIRLTIEEYDRRLRVREKEVNRQILNSTGLERKALESQKEELKARLTNIEISYSQAIEKICQLENALADTGKDISDERLFAATQALERGDYTLADQIFIDVQKSQEAALLRAARAAYGRGLIAEERVNWLEAAKHYSQSINFYKSEAALYKASVYLWKAGHVYPALGASKELLDIFEERYGEQSSEFAGATNNYAAQLYEAGDSEGATVQFIKSMDIRRALKEDDTMDFAASLANLANVYVLEEKFNAAERLHREAVKISEKIVGRTDERFTTMLNGLAETLRILEKFDESEKLFKEVISTDSKLFGDDHPAYARDLHFYSKLLRNTKRYDEAKPLLYKAIDICQRKLGEHHPNTIHVAHHFAWILRHFGQGEEDFEKLSDLQQVFGNEIGLEVESNLI